MSEYKEFLALNDIPTETHAGKTYSEFSPSEVDVYLTLHGNDALVERMKIDQKWEANSSLDREIEEKRKKVGKGKPSRSELEELTKKSAGAGDRGRLHYQEKINELLERANEYGGFSDE